MWKDKRIDFGKHTGETLLHLASWHFEYLKWTYEHSSCSFVRDNISERKWWKICKKYALKPRPIEEFNTDPYADSDDFSCKDRFMPAQCIGDDDFDYRWIVGQD